MVLSQLPVARIPDWASTQPTALIGASCWATWVVWPLFTSNMRPALSAPPENILFPSCRRNSQGDVMSTPLTVPYSNIHPKLDLGVDTLLCPGFVQNLLRKFVPGDKNIPLVINQIVVFETYAVIPASYCHVICLTRKGNGGYGVSWRISYFEIFVWRRGSIACGTNTPSCGCITEKHHFQD